MVELSNCLWVPADIFNIEQRERLEKEFTVQVKTITGETQEVCCIRLDREGYIGLPRVAGLKSISRQKVRVEDKRSRGKRVTFATTPRLRAEQESFVDEILHACATKTDFIAEAGTGKGKCLARGTLVLMYDGRTLPVEEVQVGDLLMGPDSMPRTVLSLARGREEMFKVTPVKGESYTVNRSHILSLKITGIDTGKFLIGGDGKKYRSGDVADISIDDYLNSSKTFKRVAKGWRVGVEFSGRGDHRLILPAYILGCWLGDGASYHPTIHSDDPEVVGAWRSYAKSVGMALVQDHSLTVGTYRISGGSGNTYNPLTSALRSLDVLQNKHIPYEYLTASREIRMDLLAGLLDTDGSVSCGCFDLVQKNERLARDAAFLARSLGMAAYVYGCTKRSQNGTEGKYWRVRISGDVAQIPCKVPHKKPQPRRQKKSVLMTGISVESVGEGEYFGFEIDGDRRFLLGDFTVTHNTVCGLYVIAKRGRTAAVCVDQENLLYQWIDRCKEHLGLEDEDIGIVRGPKVDYKNKKIVICMIQSLIRKDLPSDFVRGFGTVIFDESHSVGARTYSQSMMIFSAEVRFGLSATPDRRDAFRKLIQWNLGTVDVALRTEHEESNVYVLESDGVYSWSANNSKMASRFISEIADDGRRNLLLAKAIKWLYESGRDALVISDRVEQLCSLRALCEVLGMPGEDLGIYAKMETVWVYEKDPRPARRPFGWEKGTEYTPVRLALVQKTLRKPYREYVKESSRVIFATYGIMSKGVDIPRLSGGIDATPRREAKQTVGRILRTQEGKARPIWVTIADVNSFRALFQLGGRIGDYVDSNAEIYLWDMEKGRKRLDAAELQDELAERVSLLRRSKIVTAQDGNNTLLIPSTRTDRDR